MIDIAIIALEMEPIDSLVLFQRFSHLNAFIKTERVV